MKAKIENGRITGFYIGITGPKDLIEVPDEVAANSDNYVFVGGKFTERKDQDKTKKKSLEQRVEELEKLVAELIGQPTDV